MPAGDITEGQRRAERNAGTWIITAHDARHVVTGGIKPWNHTAGGIECARVGVGEDARIGTEIADHNLDRIERAVRDRRDTRVRPMQGNTLVAVIGARTLAESGVAS